MVDSAALAEVLRDVDPAMAESVGSGTAILTERSLPFDAVAVRVVVNEPWGERGAWFGLIDGTAVSLSGRPAAFGELARSAGARVVDPGGAVDFAAALLDTTRAFDQPEYRIESVEDVKMRPPLIEEETEARDRFIADHSRDIGPPAAVARPGGGFEVTAYRVRAGQVEQVVVTVHEDGSADITSHALEPTPPLPVSL